MKKLMAKPRGFTIIEVIIVLVIGAVIMVAVFLVVPQLQQQSRNSQRQALLRRVLVAARDATNQNGSLLSGNRTSTIENILGTMPNDPATGVKYGVFVSTSAQGASNIDGTIYLKYNASCSLGTVGSAENSPGSIAVVIAQEPYSDTTVNNLPRKKGATTVCIND